jgi:FkbM family methyltransferase
MVKSPNQLNPITFLDTLFDNRVDLRNVRYIADIGSRHAHEADLLSVFFCKAKAFAFECNPEVLPECYATASQNKGLSIIPCALFSYDGKIKFYQTESFSKGASSLYKFNPDDDLYKQNPHREQREVEVDCMRMDSFCKSRQIPWIDIVWMDVQGAELEVLKGFGEMLTTVRAIATEAGLRNVYLGQSLKDDIEKYLADAGFAPAVQFLGSTNAMETNIVYLNHRYLLKHAII